MLKILELYVSQINDIYKDSSATPELSYRLPFQTLLNSSFKYINVKDIKVIHEGKNIKETGKPDFFIKDRNTDVSLSYIETKSINSNEIKEEHYQIGRYISNLEKVCTTDYCRFDLYKNGKQDRSFDLIKFSRGRFVLNANEISSFEDLIRNLASNNINQNINSQELAIFLARRARLIKEILADNVDSRIPASKKIVEAFNFYQDSLNPGSTLDSFLSNYAQCLTYGLFVGKIEKPDAVVTKINIVDLLPKNQRILQTLFSFLSESSLIGQKISWIIDDICNYLNIVNLDCIGPRKNESLGHLKVRGQINIENTDRLIWSTSSIT
jgi:hypothetical protein